MEYIQKYALAIIALVAVIFAISYAYGQHTLALEHNRQIILRCVEKEANEGVSYDSCMTLWKPFLASFASQTYGSH